RDVALGGLEVLTCRQLARDRPRNVSAERFLHGVRPPGGLPVGAAEELDRDLVCPGAEPCQVGRRGHTPPAPPPEADEGDQALPSADRENHRDGERLEGGAVEGVEACGAAPPGPALCSKRRRTSRERRDERAAGVERRWDCAPADVDG